MNAEQIALALGGKRSGRQWSCKCPAHEDRAPSLIVFDGTDRVQVRCMAGCSPLDVIAELRRRGLWDTRDYQRRAQLDRPGRETPGYDLIDSNEYSRRCNPDNQPLQAPMSDYALRIWKESEDAHGTLAEKYLHGRDLVLPPFGSTQVIRYHPACPHGKARRPALIALFRDDETDRAKSIQRIFITPDAKKDCAMMLGPVGGCAMKLAITAERPDVLNICEGLETGLALAEAGINPIWAVGSAGGIQSFPVLHGITKLVIWADNDGAGLFAAEQCLRNYCNEGREVIIRTPENEDTDFADLVERKHA